ncbi:MAG: KEOPS complex subunit Cgi121 [Candidatus Thorarchaeota archaeon]
MRIEMLKSNDYASVVGFSEIQNSNRLNQNELIDLAKSLSTDSLTVQLMNGLLIADDIHLLSAAQNAVNAFSGNYMLSRSFDVEIIVYASAQRQIGKALEEFGVHDDIVHIAAMVIGADRSSVTDTLGEITKTIGKEFSTPFEASKERFERVKKYFDIDDKEISVFSDSTDMIERQKALAKCVVSRVSLVAIEG